MLLTNSQSLWTLAKLVATLQSSEKEVTYDTRDERVKNQDNRGWTALTTQQQARLAGELARLLCQYVQGNRPQAIARQNQEGQDERPSAGGTPP